MKTFITDLYLSAKIPRVIQPPRVNETATPATESSKADDKKEEAKKEEEVKPVEPQVVYKTPLNMVRRQPVSPLQQLCNCLLPPAILLHQRRPGHLA
jgi:hypothetical protein